jgi:hypothetical protein
VTAGHPRSVSGLVSTISTSLAARTKASGTVWPGGPPVIFSATAAQLGAFGCEQASPDAVLADVPVLQ